MAKDLKEIYKPVAYAIRDSDDIGLVVYPAGDERLEDNQIIISIAKDNKKFFKITIEEHDEFLAEQE